MNDLEPRHEPPSAAQDQDGTPLLTHAIEFRRRLIISLLAVMGGFVLCYVFAAEIYAFLVKPLAEASGEQPRRLIYTGMAEAFMTYLRLALWGGVIVAFPVIATQLWGFVAPALYREEKRAFLPFLIASPVLFLAGAALAYFFVFPAAWAFFLSFESLGTGGGLPIEMEARVSEYLSLSMALIMAFGLAFQLPVALVLLARAGIVTAEKLSGFRRFSIILIFIVAAILTPPDIISQTALALPLLLLYEISIIGARWAQKQRGR